MDGLTLARLSSDLIDLGIVKSDRHFARAYCGRVSTYVRDAATDRRRDRAIPAATVATVRTRLAAVTALLPSDIRNAVERAGA